jgi:hypothetical protein
MGGTIGTEIERHDFGAVVPGDSNTGGRRAAIIKLVDNEVPPIIVGVTVALCADVLHADRLIQQGR